VIDESDLQYEKHDEQRTSTFRGITIVRSDDDENVFDSIRVNRDSDSNVTEESGRRGVRKEDSLLPVKLRASSDCGIQILKRTETQHGKQRKN
jgi:hypothetical protein